MKLYPYRNRIPEKGQEVDIVISELTYPYGILEVKQGELVGFTGKNGLGNLIVMVDGQKMYFNQFTMNNVYSLNDKIQATLTNYEGAHRPILTQGWTRTVTEPIWRYTGLFASNSRAFQAMGILVEHEVKFTPHPCEYDFLNRHKLKMEKEAKEWKERNS